ncbi:MAG: hypothetical protein JWM80_2972 [Cyanobacteria bacterium RYN_339]|nr:hypothetical protein [Cyanobacteria bacterium RYN_339]
MTPLLSILLPTFNRVAYLRECLDSLLATTVDCEVVIGDNASEDDTPALLAGYNDPRIKYHRHAENLGPIANFNFLLGQARGRYVCIFGDDDIALPGNFEPKVGLLENHPHIDMCFSRAAGMDAAGRTLYMRDVMGALPYGYLGGRDEFAELFVNCYIPWQTLVFRRSVLAEIGDLGDGWGLQASHDWYWLQMMSRGRQTAFIPDRMVQIRFHAESFSTREAAAKGMFGTDRMIIWRRWLLEHPDPPVITELTWERMLKCVLSDAQDLGGSEEQRERAMTGLAELKQAYGERLTARVRAALRQGDPYQPGTPAWPLEGLGKRSFAYFPNWSEPGWRDVLHSYATSFAATDDVTLVLVLDPRQGLTVDEAGAMVMAELEAAGLANSPDLLLVPEPAGDEDFARVFAAVGAVVAPGDPLQAARATRMGKGVVPSLEPAAWLA